MYTDLSYPTWGIYPTRICLLCWCQIILSWVLLKTTTRRRPSVRVSLETNKLLISLSLIESCKTFLKGLDEPGAFRTMLLGRSHLPSQTFNFTNHINFLIYLSTISNQFTDNSSFLTDKNVSNPPRSVYLAHGVTVVLCRALGQKVIPRCFAVLIKKWLTITCPFSCSDI